MIPSKHRDSDKCRMSTSTHGASGRLRAARSSIRDEKSAPVTTAPKFDQAAGSRLTRAAPKAKNLSPFGKAVTDPPDPAVFHPAVLAYATEGFGLPIIDRVHRFRIGAGHARQN